MGVVHDEDRVFLALQPATPQRDLLAVDPQQHVVQDPGHLVGDADGDDRADPAVLVREVGDRVLRLEDAEGHLRQHLGGVADRQRPDALRQQSTNRDQRADLAGVHVATLARPVAAVHGRCIQRLCRLRERHDRPVIPEAGVASPLPSARFRPA